MVTMENDKILSDRELLISIYQMLCKVCSYIDKVESLRYRDMEDQRAFSINVAADLYVEQLEKLRNGETGHRDTSISR